MDERVTPPVPPFGLWHVFRGAAVIIGGSALVYLLSVAHNIIVVRLLGQKLVGELAVAGSVLETVYVLAGLGLGTGVVCFLARALETGDAARGNGVIRAAVRLTAAGAGVGTIGLVVFALVAARRFYSADDYPLLIWLLMVQAVSVLPVCLTRVYFSVYQAAHRAGYEQTSRIAENVFRLMLVPATFLVFRDLRAAAAAIVAAQTLTWLVNERLVRRSLPLDRWRGAAPAPFARELVAYSWPLAVTANFQALVGNMDILCLGYFLPSAEVGPYKVAASFALFMWVVPQALTYLLFPIGNRLLAAKATAALGLLHQRAYKYLVLLNLAPLVGLSVLSREFIRLMYGEEYLAGAAVVPILMTAVFIKGLYVPCQQILAAERRTRLELALNAASLAVGVAVNLVLIPVLGPVGAAAGVVAAHLTMAVSEMVAARRLAGFWSFDGKATAVVIAAGAALAAAVRSGWGPWPRAGSGAAIVLAAWAVFLVIDPTERAALGRALVQRGREPSSRPF